MTGNAFSLTNDFGAEIDSSEILDGTIVAADLGTIPVSTFTNDSGYLTSEVDGSTTNELITGAVLNGNNLEITDAGGVTTVDLSVLNNSGTDDQNLTGATLTGNSLTIDIENGASVTVDLTNLVNDADFDPTNEIQDLSLVGNTLRITNNAGATNIDLSGYLDNTDNQDLTLTGDVLALTNDGTTVSLAAYKDNTDNQQINLTGNNLTLSNGTGADSSVDLSGYLDNTDSQNLSLAGTILNISGGNSQDLSSILD